MAETEQNRAAIEVSLAKIGDFLTGAQGFRRVSERLFMVRQGSAYVMITVQPFGEDRAVVRLAAQLVSGISMTGGLALRLLKINSRLRFGAFGFHDEGNVVTLSHSILGGETLDREELSITLEDLARLADEFDDRLVALGGGCRMTDLIQDEAITQAARACREGPAMWDEPS
jgi:hypothetical protein